MVPESGSKYGVRRSATIQMGMTAAHRTLPFGTKLKVTHGSRSVVVTVNDRGPFIKRPRARPVDRCGKRGRTDPRQGASVAWSPKSCDPFGRFDRPLLLTASVSVSVRVRTQNFLPSRHKRRLWSHPKTAGFLLRSAPSTTFASAAKRSIHVYVRQVGLLRFASDDGR